ncbi:phenylalanine--tRNA ligase subunit beta [Gordonia sp. (in: high G+C Gram-positive bacteria)]|uniref:phenylalanine--tRNA ligase subunit beta n=1 Tax=Gordonia sp. (in: high G+C Gram-positive bacteria) TaxID=84139 RepID=UPI0016A7A0B5|nr:phenylalanine--tRNA ligase subunit beta [Gordonia sp. (in: high G+C Gram-positive bacteria)]NLG45999.1 phenylalanine--tRNA ligase subunit beta [Gordonia sp. (in: high G+C Gram-positive bacteria)]
MRLPQSWLTQVLRKGSADVTPSTAEIDAGFVRVGFEIEDVEPFPEITGPLVIGRVAAIEELTEFKKPIRFCQVEVGEDAPRDIVCGARNFAVGDLVVVALPGAVLPGDFAIATRKTYGKTSDGMICSVTELGVGNDHSGILVLAPGTAEPGADAREVLGLVDTAIEVNVTPDRGYAFSMRGLGRELASAFSVPYVDDGLPGEPLPVTTAREPWPVAIDDDSKATRYTARVIDGVDAASSSPWWMAKRLMVAGIRPISAIVDITNYVMIELGQPLHAFDADKVVGTVRVRAAVAGETLETLDGVTRKLDPEDVVIADDSGPIALAGVMGGASTEVTDQTTTILLESANFDQVRVFRSGKRHKLTSEAAKRFERMVDPEVTAVASDRAAALIVEYAGGRIAGDLSDARVETPAVAAIEIDPALPDQTAGIPYPEGTTAARLREVGCEVETREVEGSARLLVTPPSWRPDLRQRADLVEEVLRLEGLEDIPAVVPRAPGGRGLTAVQRRRRSIGAGLAADGYIEVLPYPFLPAGVFDTWGLADDDPRRQTVSVLNPLESDRPELNTTLLPGLLEMTARNIARGQRDLALYAIGQVVLGGDTGPTVPALDVTRRPTADEQAALDASLPAQPLHVGVILTGLREPAGPLGAGRPADAYDAFEAARQIGRASGVELALVADDTLPWHPGRCARLEADGVVVGHAGELHPAVLERAGLPARLCAVEIDIDALPLRENLPSPKVSPFPAVLQDVNVVVAKTVAAQDVEEALRAGAGELLESIALFDVFEGEQVGEDNKSLTFALTFRAPDRTLTEDDGSAAKMAAVAHAGETVGARLR